MIGNTTDWITRGMRIQFLEGGSFFIFQNSQTKSGARPASSTQGTRESPEDKAVKV